MLETLLIILSLVGIAMIWQHRRYQYIRRYLAQDLQRPLHSGEAFHVIVFFKLKPGDKVVETAGRFAQQILSSSRARLVYAGQAAFTVNALHLDNREWDGVLLFEFPNRTDYEQSRVDARAVLARRLFADSYLHGMRRNRSASMLLPQWLLRHRVKDLLTGRWRIEPLQNTLAFETAPEFQIWRGRVSRLRALHEVNREGLVMFNLVKYGPAGHQDIAEIYGDKLLSRMAVFHHGPLHMGRSVALEEFARFDRVYIAYYPSARYFADLIASQYFHNIAGSKLMGDSLRVATAPITARLQQAA
jgi:hypothetical protein